jgi:hypothetical protein
MPQPEEKILLEEALAAEKRVARQEIFARLKTGVSLELLQSENWIFRKLFFANARIFHLNQTVGG